MGVAREAVTTVGDIATRGIYPDATILLDLDVDTSLQRATEPPDRMEARGKEFLQAVRDGFLKESKTDANISVVDASKSIDDVEVDIRSVIQQVIDKRKANAK